MIKSSLLSLSLLSSLLLACGGASPPSSMAAGPEHTTPPADPPAALDCSAEPTADAPAADAGSTEGFSVTGDAVAAGTAIQVGFGADFILSQSEGGSRYIKIHALNDCGLWISETYVGSEIGGDADVRKTTVTLVKADDDSFKVEALGTVVNVSSTGDGTFTATLAQPIATYEGE